MIDPITGLPSSNIQNKDGTISYASPIIDATKLGTTPVVAVPPPVTVPDTTYTSAINSVGNSAQASQDAIQAEQDAQAKLAQSQGVSTDISRLESQLGGKAADTANLYSTAGGVNDAYKQLKDLNAQAIGLKNEASAIPIQTPLAYQGTAATQQTIASVNRDKLSQNALKALSLGQQAAIAQGNFDVAKSLADQQIEVKYSQMEADLKSKQTQLAALDKYVLTPAQNKAKEALARKYKLQDQEIADKKAQETANNAIALEVAKNGGTPEIQASITQAIKEGKSTSEILNLAGSALKTPNTEIIKMKQGDNEVAYIYDKTTNKIVKTLGVSGGSGGMGGGVAGKSLNPAVDVILASGKFTKDQANSIRNAINNGENPAVVIRNNAKQLMTGANQTKIENYEATQSAMKGLKDSLNAFYAAGGDTSLLKGNFEKVSNRFGQVQDPKLAQLAVEVQSQLQSYRNAISGTAYSDQEGRDIASVFPGINKSKQLNDSIFAGRDKALQASIDGMYKSVLGEKVYSSLNQTEKPKVVVSKGNMNDGDFVRKALSLQKVDFVKFINGIQPGEIPVIDNATGQPGYITPAEFDPTKFTKA